MTGLMTPYRDGALVSGRGLFSMNRSDGLAAGDASGESLMSVERQTISKAILPDDIRVRNKRFQPMVILLIGRRDAGKTLTMTALADLMKTRYAARNKLFKVASNYDLKLADYYSPHIIDRIMEFPWWARDMYLCIDEIQTAASNRRSMSRSNVYLATFLTMIRKRRIELIFTTQFPQVLDIQLLTQVDLFIECERSPDANYITLYVHDWWGQFTGQFNRKPWPPLRQNADWVTGLAGTSKVFGQYRTEEVIAPMFVNELTRELMIAREVDSGGNDDWNERLPVGDEEYLMAKYGQVSRDDALDSVDLMAPKEESIEEYIAGLPERFSVAATLDDAQVIDPALTSRAKWEARLSDDESVTLVKGGYGHKGEAA